MEGEKSDSWAGKPYRYKNITKLQNYYRKAIKDNVDTDKMKTAIYASLMHCSSTDKKPMHVSFEKGSVMSRRKQQSAFDQVSEFDRGRRVAYRDCGLSFREIDSSVERNQTTVMRICDRWMQEGTTDRRGRSHLP
ncbi:transposable element Tcb1 transposase [Trichonephila clavipes]|nr:transposable element Tcb1 transposase [Trichonephila clavipes]